MIEHLTTKPSEIDGDSTQIQDSLNYWEKKNTCAIRLIHISYKIKQIHIFSSFNCLLIYSAAHNTYIRRNQDSFCTMHVL